VAKLSSHKHRSAALLALAVVGPALTILLSQTYGQPLPMDPQQPWAVAELQGLRGPCQVSRRANVSLGPDERQVMDLYVPDRPNGAAALVIHGGAWRGGSKDGSGMVLIAGVLASHGFVAAAVNYRLAPTYKWPAQLQDCQLAVRWLRENADMLGIHADRIGALGTSAGGHLAAMLALVDGDLAAGCKVQAACNYFGPSDLLSHSSW
jgi:acetyl esterase/lipase